MVALGRVHSWLSTCAFPSRQLASVAHCQCMFCDLSVGIQFEPQRELGRVGALILRCALRSLAGSIAHGCKLVGAGSAVLPTGRLQRGLCTRVVSVLWLLQDPLSFCLIRPCGVSFSATVHHFAAYSCSVQATMWHSCRF